jgi:hypothetical protein
VVASLEGLRVVEIADWMAAPGATAIPAVEGIVGPPSLAEEPAPRGGAG